MRAERLVAAGSAVLCLLLLLAAVPVRAATILVYHSFGGRSSMSISMTAFAAQLDYLERTGHKVISLDELVRCIDEKRNPPEGAVVIAVDDGWSSVMDAYAELKRRNLPFTLFLPMAYVGSANSPKTLTQADIDELKTYPTVTFANHSYSHSPRLTRDAAFAREDIRKSVERFRQVVGHDTKYFAYPYGSTNAAYTQMLEEAGLKYRFVTGFQPVSAQTPVAAIPRIAAHHLSLPMLASVLHDHEAMMARVKPAPATDGPMLSARPPAEKIPRNIE